MSKATDTASEFQLEMIDFGSSYQAARDSAVSCLRCFCGSGCFCGSLFES